MKPSTGPARVDDVARLAGVSQATVSRAFNAPHLLGTATLERVRDAARRLDYAPYGVARSLRRRRSMVVGMLVPSLAQAYHATAVERVHALLARAGYTMLLGTSAGDPDGELAAAKAMVAQGVDGMIVVARPMHPDTLEVTRRAGVPTMHGWVASPGRPSVAFDHAAAMAQVARHLLSLGHREVAVAIPFRVAGDRERGRLAAIRAVLAEAGVPLPSRSVFDEVGLAIEGGRQAVLAMRERAPRATALICGNDQIAAGAILTAQAYGMDVPADLSITGYNDLEIATVMRPAITTVRTPAALYAERAVQALLAWMSSGEPPATELLPTELVPRGSTGAPGGADRPGRGSR